MLNLTKAALLLFPLTSSFLPLQASDDVIRERPEGETTIFWRSGGAYEYFYDVPSPAPQTGLALEMIYAPSTGAEQAREVFIKDILSTGREGTYVRGTLSADGIQPGAVVVLIDTKTGEVVNAAKITYDRIVASTEGISPVVLSSSNDESIPAYDLQGRMVAVPTKGIYISGGRKVIQ